MFSFKEAIVSMNYFQTLKWNSSDRKRFCFHDKLEFVNIDLYEVDRNSARLIVFLQSIVQDKYVEAQNSFMDTVKHGFYYIMS